MSDPAEACVCAYTHTPMRQSSFALCQSRRNEAAGLFGTFATSCVDIVTPYVQNKEKPKAHLTKSERRCGAYFENDPGCRRAWHIYLPRKRDRDRQKMLTLCTKPPLRFTSRTWLRFEKAINAFLLLLLVVHSVSLGISILPI